MSRTVSSAPHPVAAAPALLERHGEALRRYLGQLPGADQTRVEGVLKALAKELERPTNLEDDPAVWLFTRARGKLVAGGPRGDVLLGEAADLAEVEDGGETDSRLALHRAFGRLTPKQQEALRLKYQYGFHADEIARITGVGSAAAGGLLQHALTRVVQALPTEAGKNTVRINDPRILAYALDEMEAAERKAFAEAGHDGKELLQTADAIRRSVRELTKILQNGAPPPRRRRDQRGALAWWSVWACALVLGGVLFWWYAGREPEVAVAVEAVAELSAAQARASVGTSRAVNGSRSDVERVAIGLTPKRALRPGEAAWERKPFGRGDGQPARETGDRSTGTVGIDANNGVQSPVAAGTAAAGDEESSSREPNDEETAAILWPTGAGGAGGAAGDYVEPGRQGGAGKSGGARVAAPAVSEAEPESAGPRIGGVGSVPPMANLRRVQQALARGQWPERDSVAGNRLPHLAPPEWPTEEFSSERLSITTESAPSPFEPERIVTRVVLQAKPAPPPKRPPANLVLAIDVSDSMSPSNRLPLVQAGIQRLIERLRPDDRVAVVTYAAAANEALESAPLGENGRKVRGVVRALEASGRTNGFEGLALGYGVASRNRVSNGLNAVILCTDGNFNLGETDEAALAAMAARHAEQGIKLSVFGFGRSDRNDLRLELLAQAGGGESCYVNTVDEAERRLSGQIHGLLEPVAREIVWRVDFDPAVVKQATVQGGAGDLRAVELLPGRQLVALCELTFQPGAAHQANPRVRIEVTYDSADDNQQRRMSRTEETRAKNWAHTRPAFRFAMAWSELEHILRGGPREAGPALARLEAWVGEVLPDDTGGYREELTQTIALARAAAIAEP